MADARKFGRVIFTQDLAGTYVDLGPEPLGDGLTPAVFAARLQARDRAIKPLLLDQTFLAGLGNIYTDEALFRARLHPLTPASALTRAEATALLTAIREVLREGIAHCGTSLDWIYPDGRMQEFLRVYGRAGAPCTACGAPIVRAVLGQRGTWTCPRCQPEPGVSGYSPRHALPARRTRPP
jgi:formamidopyrimidine-DNA glycosylase